MTTFSTASRARPPGAPAIRPMRPGSDARCGSYRGQGNRGCGGARSRAGAGGLALLRGRQLARSLRPEALRSRAPPPGRLPRPRRQAARAPTPQMTAARTSWPGRPPRAGHPLAAQDHIHGRSLRSRLRRRYAPPLSVIFPGKTSAPIRRTEKSEQVMHAHSHT